MNNFLWIGLFSVGIFSACSPFFELKSKNKQQRLLAISISFPALVGLTIEILKTLQFPIFTTIVAGKVAIFAFGIALGAILSVTISRSLG